MTTRRALRWCGMSTLLLFLLVAGCGDSTGPSGDGLVAGTYQASFTVPLSTQTPGGLIGDHEFTFRVDDPEDDNSFELVSSRKRSRTLGGEPTEWETGYLSSSTERIIASSIQWRVQWRYRDLPGLAVNVTLVNEDGGYNVRFCRGVRLPLENYGAHSCSVERVN